MGIAGHIRAVLDLFDIDVVGCALHTLDVAAAVVDDVHYYLVGLDIDDAVVAVASVDASTSAHPAEMSSNWEDSVDD